MKIIGRLHRTQLLLEEEQYQRLRRQAAQEGISMSELVRRLINEASRPPRPRDHANLHQLRGIVDDPTSGRDHDPLLYGG